MQTVHSQSDTKNKNWLRFLAGWSIGTSIVVAGLIIAILTLVMPASNPNPLGDIYFELIAAGQAPALYRLTIVFDVLAWVGWAGLFIAFAALLSRVASVRSTLIALLATGMSVGFLGACLRLVGTPKFADQYLAASSTTQSAILQSYDGLLQIINITFSAGGLLAGTALLLIASAARHLVAFPRWSMVLMGIAGVIHLLKALSELVTGTDLGPLALLANIFLIVSLVTVARKSHTLSKKG